MKPPRLPRRLLERLLPSSDRSAIIGDLDEEFLRYVAPGRKPWRALAWYWRQCLLSLPPVLRLGVQTVATRALLDLARDVRHAVMLAGRQPGFTAAALLTYALAVAVTTAVATLAYIVLLRPLPYASPERLVHLSETDRNRPGSSGSFSFPDFVSLHQRARAFESVAGYSGGSRTLSGSGPAARVPMAEVTAGFFETLGVAPLLGRAFTPHDEPAGAAPVVILSHGAWVRRFGGRATILGERVVLNGIPHTVVGILPAGFEFAPRGLAELWLPLRPSPAQVERGYFHWLDVIARLGPGITHDQARDELAILQRQAALGDPKWHGQRQLALEPLRDRIVSNVRPALLVLLAAVSLVLLGACASIAGLFIARWTGRAHEAGIRTALGASRWQLRRQLLTEGLVLGAGGSSLGLLGGAWLLKIFAAALPVQQRAALPHHDALALDVPTAACVLAASMSTAAMSGLIPAMRATRHHGPELLLRSPRLGSPVREARSRTTLVAVQVAFAAMLLVGVALLGRSTWHLLQASPGFDPEPLLTMHVNLSGERYDSAPAVRDFHSRALQRLTAIPGTLGAATISQLPLTGRGRTGTVSFAEGVVEDGADASVTIRTITPNYFDVIGIPLIHGRAFAPGDRESSPRLVIVNQAFARRFSQETAVIGRGVVFEFFAGRPRWEIVGVVGDERFDALDRPPLPVVYFPFSQDTGGAFSIVMRTVEDPVRYAAPAAAAIAEIDPAVPVFQMRPMTQIIAESPAVFLRRQVLALLALFGVAALVVSATGLYAVLAQLVSRQRREIGVRFALGATRLDVARLVLARGAWPALAGLLGGLSAAAATGNVLDTLLFEISAIDPLSMLAVALVLSATAILACLMPMRRAMRVDPAIVLRWE